MSLALFIEFVLGPLDVQLGQLLHSSVQFLVDWGIPYSTCTPYPAANRVRYFIFIVNDMEGVQLNIGWSSVTPCQLHSLTMFTWKGTRSIWHCCSNKCRYAQLWIPGEAQVQCPSSARYEVKADIGTPPKPKRSSSPMGFSKLDVRRFMASRYYKLHHNSDVVRTDTSF